MLRSGSLTDATSSDGHQAELRAHLVSGLVPGPKNTPRALEDLASTAARADGSSGACMISTPNLANLRLLIISRGLSVMKELTIQHQYNEEWNEPARKEGKL